MSARKDPTPPLTPSPLVRFFMFLNANSNTTLKKSNFDGFYLSGYTDSWADDEKYECDVGWQAFQAGCYKLTSEKTDWNTAQKTCQKMEANLVSIHTLPELEFIIRDLKKGVFLSGGFFVVVVFYSTVLFPLKVKNESKLMFFLMLPHFCSSNVSQIGFSFNWTSM